MKKMDKNALIRFLKEQLDRATKVLTIEFSLTSVLKHQKKQLAKEAQSVMRQNEQLILTNQAVMCQNEQVLQNQAELQRENQRLRGCSVLYI